MILKTRRSLDTTRVRQKNIFPIYLFCTTRYTQLRRSVINCRVVTLRFHHGIRVIEIPSKPRCPRIVISRVRENAVASFRFRSRRISGYRR